MKSASDSFWWSHWPCWNCIVSPRSHPVISAYSQYLRMDTKHYIPPDCQPGLMPQIEMVRCRMAELGYNAALSPDLTPTTTLSCFLQVIQCTGEVIRRTGCSALRDALWGGIIQRSRKRFNSFTVQKPCTQSLIGGGKVEWTCANESNFRELAQEVVLHSPLQQNVILAF